MENDFILYLLPRKDMDSLNHTGKVIAQGAHAANHAASTIGKGHYGTKAMQEFAEWEKQTKQDFGTTVVLGSVTRRSVRYLDAVVTIDDIRQVVETARNLGFAAGVTNDPSYPLSDGRTMHAFPCDTCGWLFGSKSALAGLLSNFHLHSADPASAN